MRKRLRENSNAGFSLVEILVSIAIIAVILLPVLAAFSSYSTQAIGLKEVQRGTSLAQNVMEVAKKGSFDDYKKEANFVNTLAGYSVSDIYEALPGKPDNKLPTLVTDGQGDLLASCYYDENSEIKFKNRTDGKYSFVYKNVQDGFNKYDVVVDMTSSGYRTEAKDGYNDMSLGQVSGLDSKRTAVITTTKEIMQQAAEFFVEDGKCASVEDAKSKILVRIDINVEGNDENASGEIVLSAKPTYFLKNNQRATWSPSADYIFRKTYKTSNAEHLEKIYILYSQSYSSERNAADEIDFNFDDSCNITRTCPKIYIVKQSKTVETNGVLDIYSNDDSQFSEGGFLSDFRGNIDVSYLNASTYVTAKLHDSVTGRKSAKGKRLVDYKFVESENIMTDSDDDTSSSDDLSNNRIYDVTVNVYKAGSDFKKLVASLSSTRRE